MAENEFDQYRGNADKDAASEVEYTYASALEMFSNNWDLRFVFGDRKPNGSVVRKCGIVMSHRHAKVLNQILTKQIEHIEKAWGPIKTDNVKLIEAEGREEEPSKAAQESK